MLMISDLASLKKGKEQTKKRENRRNTSSELSILTFLISISLLWFLSLIRFHVTRDYKLFLYCAFITMYYKCV